MFSIKGTLTLDNKIVGYRVLYDDCFLYDISKEDLELISEDFNISIVKSSSIVALPLIPKGDKLVSVDGVNVDELTYGSFVALKGYKHMVKTDTGLKKLYNHYNKLCFNDALPKTVSVEWSTRLTGKAGVCIRREVQNSPEENIFTIKLSTHYHEKFPNQTIDTLVHEMIHVYHPYDKHGPRFQRTMNDLNRKHGLNMSIYSDEVAKVNYIYTCMVCGKEYKRAKSLNTLKYRCGEKGCRGSLMEFDLRD